MEVTMIALFAEVISNEAAPWAASGAFMALSATVIWLAKAYRDDMKERASESAKSHEKVAAEFKKTSEETRDKFLESLEKQDMVIDKLADSITDLNRRVTCAGQK